MSTKKIMPISQIHIVNYRSIEDETFELSSFSILVGKNNVGKSNVISAISFLLEGSAKTINELDFNDPSKDVCITAKVENVDQFLELSVQKHREKIAKCIDEGRLTVRRIARDKGNDVSRLELLDPSSHEFGLPTGIDAALKQILPEVIMIEAFKDPSSEAVGKSTAALGKIIKQIVAQVAATISEDLKEAYEKLNRLLNVVEVDGVVQADNRAEELRQIEQNILRHLATMFEDVGVRIRIDFPELPDLMTRARVELYEGGEWTAPELKGQGMQRVLYVALLQALAEQIRSSTAYEIKRPFILLIEEPEAFLHPSLLGKMRNALESISLSNQVAFATHSPEMVSPHKLSDVILVRKIQNSEGKQCSVRLRGDPAMLGQIGQKRLNELLQYQRSSRFLFSDAIAVVEGPSDVVLLEAMSEILAKESLDTLNIVFIDAGGKDLVAEFTEALEGLGLHAIGIVDLDYLWKGAGRIASGMADYSRFREKFHAHYIEEYGNKNLGGGNKYDKHKALDILTAEFEEVYRRLIEKIEEERKVYILPSGEVEDYANMSTRQKGEYLKAATEIRNGRREIKNSQELVHILKAGLNLRC